MLIYCFKGIYENNLGKLINAVRDHKIKYAFLFGCPKSPWLTPLRYHHTFSFTLLKWFCIYLMILEVLHVPGKYQHSQPTIPPPPECELLPSRWDRWPAPPPAWLGPWLYRSFEHARWRGNPRAPWNPTWAKKVQLHSCSRHCSTLWKVKLFVCHVRRSAHPLLNLPRSQICAVIHMPIVHSYCSMKRLPLFLVCTVCMCN